MPFFKNALLTFVVQILSNLLGLGSDLITARVLGPHDKGLFALVLLVPQTVVKYSNLGLGAANIYSLRKKEAKLSDLVSNSLVASIAISLTSIAILVILSDFFLERMAEGLSKTYFLLGLVLIPLMLVESYFNSILRALGRFDLFNTFRALQPVLKFFGLALVLVFMGKGLNEAVSIMVLSWLLLTAWLLYVIHKFSRLQIRMNLSLLSRSIRFGLKTFGQSLAGFMHLRTDVLIVAFFLRPSEVAFYTIAVFLAERIMLFQSSIGLVLFPKITGQNQEEASRFCALTSRNAVFLSIVLALPLFVGGPLLINLLYGEDYLSAVGPLYFLLPGVVLLTVSKVLARFFTSIDKQEVVILARITAIVLNVALNLFLIPQFGVAGAAVSSTASYSFEAGLIFWAFRRYTGRTVRETFLITLKDFERYLEKISLGMRKLRALIQYEHAS